MNEPEIRPALARVHGFTVVEMLVVTTVTALLAVGLLSVFSSSGEAFAELNADAEADALVLRTTDRLDDVLRYALPSSVDLRNATTISFSSSVGWDGFAPIPATPQWLFLNGDTLFLDNLALIDGVTFFEAAIDGSQLTITLEMSLPVGGAQTVDTVERRFVYRHLFTS